MSFGLKSPELYLYEVETVPEGFDALYAALSPEAQDMFRLHLGEAFERMGCVGFLNANPFTDSIAHCDSFVAELLGLPYRTALKECPQEGNLFVRTPHPTEHELSPAEYHSLRARSATDIYAHSDKYPLLGLGIARSMDLVKEIPEGNVVIKPWRGTRSRGIHFYLPSCWDEDRLAQARGEIEVDFRMYGKREFLVMPYTRPIRVSVDGVAHDQILRLYFSVAQHGLYRYLGGITTEVPSEYGAEAGMSVHGSRDDARYRPIKVV